MFCWEAFKCGGILLGGISLWRDFARGFFLWRDLCLEGFCLKATLRPLVQVAYQAMIGTEDPLDGRRTEGDLSPRIRELKKQKEK